MNRELVRAEPWHTLSRWTSARIAMGRAGVSTPTQALLEFNLDHAQARDAIYTPFDSDVLQREFQLAGFNTLAVRSCAQSRTEYLRRPDLGAALDPRCIATLTQSEAPKPGRLSVVIADGLSALAPAHHALEVLLSLRQGLGDWQLDDIVVASQARVALADEIGEQRGAEAVLMLIGERPGLKSPDSLGAYLTYSPRKGRMDSERNCVSNIHRSGLSYSAATSKLLHLLAQARALGTTGIALKEDSTGPLIHGSREQTGE